MKVLKKLPLRVALLPLLLLGLLSSCAVYDTVFHPHRLPTPKMDDAAKAKYRAAEKARHKGLSLKAPEPSTNATDTGGGSGDPAAPTAAPGSTDDKKKTLTYGELPEGTRVKYDKQGLVRKSMLDRMANNGHKLHHYDTRPLTPREASRDNRKIRKKGHTDHSKEAAPRDKAPREPLNPALDTGPDPGAPVTTPNSPAEEPAKAPRKAAVKAPKPARTKAVAARGSRNCAGREDDRPRNPLSDASLSVHGPKRRGSPTVPELSRQYRLPERVGYGRPGAPGPGPPPASVIASAPGTQQKITWRARRSPAGTPFRTRAC